MDTIRVVNKRNQVICELSNETIYFDIIDLHRKHAFASVVKELHIFGVSTESIEEARKDLEEDLDVFLKYHERKGTLKEALDYFGIYPK